MPNDARNKLRNMGGIMASYPELMQAATQGYQPGGMVTPTVPMVDNITVPGIGAPVVGLGRVPPMMPQGPRPGGLPLIMPERPVQRFVAGMQPDPYAPTPGSYLLDEPDQTVDDLLEGSGAETFTVPERMSPPSTEESPPDIVRSQNELRRKRGLPPLNPAAEREFLKSAAEAPLPQDVAEAKSLEAELAAIQSRKIDGIPASSADAAREEELRNQLGMIGRRAGETIAAEDVAMSMPLKPQPLSQAQIDKATELVRKDPNMPFLQEEEAASEITDGKETDTGTGTGTGGPRRTPQPTKRDLRSRYKEKIELFKEIYGEDDEDRARDKAMSLAMLGLAIASGQSPDALTNIAQGALVGLQGMSEQEKARREREQGLRTLALETAIAEESAATEAERRAAEKDLEFEQEKSLEAYKAQIGAMYGGNSRDARNIIDFTQNAYDSAFKAASEQTAPDYDSNIETPHEYAMRQAEKAASSMQRMFPGYGGQIAQTDGTSGGESGTIPTVTTQEEYDDLPSGSQFMQNGQLRRKP